jgi:geranylgeranyl reductase family protein
MENLFDAVIIGAGPSGSTVAKLIAEQGNHVLVLEEHHEVGKPVQCAGLVTPRIFDHVPENGCVLNEVHGARIYSPSGRELVIDAKKTKAVVIDRVKFDQGCMSRAIHVGAEVWLGCKALSAEYQEKNIEITVLKAGQRSKITTKLLIGADGVQSRVAAWFGLKGPSVILPGFSAEMANVNVESKFVELFLGNEVAPNFFAWVIPKAKTSEGGQMPARVGLACTGSSRTAYEFYRQLFQHPLIGPKLKGAKPIQYIAGGIPIGLVPKSYANNVMLVGDAAGQVKPTSGGGVYTGIICAEHCAKVANAALESKDYSAKFLKNYQKLWYDAIGKELKRGMRLHKVYMHLRDNQLEDGFKLLQDEKIVEIISKHGDIDYPSKLAMRLFKKVPALLKFARPYLRSFF